MKATNQMAERATCTTKAGCRLDAIHLWGCPEASRKPSRLTGDVQGSEEESVRIALQWRRITGGPWAWREYTQDFLPLALRLPHRTPQEAATALTRLRADPSPVTQSFEYRAVEIRVHEKVLT